MKDLSILTNLFGDGTKLPLDKNVDQKSLTNKSLSGAILGLLNDNEVPSDINKVLGSVFNDDIKKFEYVMAIRLNRLFANHGSKHGFSDINALKVECLPFIYSYLGTTDEKEKKRIEVICSSSCAIFMVLLYDAFGYKLTI